MGGRNLDESYYLENDMGLVRVVNKLNETRKKSESELRPVNVEPDVRGPEPVRQSIGKRFYSAVRKYLPGGRAEISYQDK